MNLARALAADRTLRTVGFDDGPFRRHPGGNVALYGVVCAGTRFEGLITGHVRQDGWNAGPVLAKRLVEGKFLAQVHAVLLDGLAFGGLNVVDLPWLAACLQRPCVAVMRRPPDLLAMHAAIAHLPRPRERLRRLQAAGPVFAAGPMHFQVAGTTAELAAALLLRVTDSGHVPEPLRLAHLIAGAIARGESGNRA